MFKTFAETYMRLEKNCKNINQSNTKVVQVFGSTVSAII